MSKSEDAITVQNISKIFKIYHDRPLTLKEKILKLRSSRYTPFYALRDISFTVKKGEALALIGHNGCGKSTMLSIIAGILYPDTGTVNVQGRISSLIELGAGFHPDFTGRENIYTNAAIFGLSRKQTEKQMDSIIEFSELKEFIDNPIRTYSSGMYMKLAFSVAVHINPDVLLIDEILAVGDSNFQKKCFDKMMQFKASNATIILVTHNTSAVERICDRAIWINEGVIAKEGVPNEVIAAYNSEMDARYRATLALSNPKQEEEKIEEDAPISVESIKMFNSASEENYTFKTGEKVTIELTYSYKKKIEKPEMEITFYSSDGKSIFETKTPIKNYKLKCDNKMIFSVEKFNLLGGSYKVQAAPVIDTVRGSGLKQCSFSMISPERHSGIIMLDYNWQS